MRADNIGRDKRAPQSLPVQWIAQRLQVVIAGEFRVTQPVSDSHDIFLYDDAVR